MQNNQSGQTLIEVVIALGFVSIVAGAFVALGMTAVRNSVIARNQQNAEKLTQEAMEQILVTRDQGGNVAALGGLQWSDVFSQSTCSSNAAVTQFSPNPDNCIEYLDSNIPPINYVTFLRKTRVFDQSGDTPTQIKSFIVLVQWTDGAGIHTTNLIRKIGKDKLR